MRHNIKSLVKKLGYAIYGILFKINYFIFNFLMKYFKSLFLRDLVSRVKKLPTTKLERIMLFFVNAMAGRNLTPITLQYIQKLLQDMTLEQKELLFRSAARTVTGQPLTDETLSTLECATLAKLVYSQEGEDLFLDRLLHSQKNGFFVDIGAHHPKRFSNTYLLYRRGWRGINIDATPGSMEAFKQIRSNDLNLELAIGPSKEPIEFTIFFEGALNTFDQSLAQQYSELGYKVKEKIVLIPHNISDVLDEYLVQDLEIDLLSIDLEGLDFLVLRSWDWEKHKPKIIIVEIFIQNIKDLYENELTQFLESLGYNPIGKLWNSVIFQRKP